MNVASCRLQIAQNIGPLVRCFCDDTTRIFFQSKKHWRDGIESFVKLVAIISVFPIHEEEGIVAVDTLLKYDGLLQSIIQWNFWEEEYRPDIVNEIGEAELEGIRQFGNAIINVVVCDKNYLREPSQKKAKI